MTTPTDSKTGERWTVRDNADGSRDLMCDGPYGPEYIVAHAFKSFSVGDFAASLIPQMAQDLNDSPRLREQVAELTADRDQWRIECDDAVEIANDRADEVAMLRSELAAKEETMAELTQALRTIKGIQPQALTTIIAHGFIFARDIAKPIEELDEVARWEKLAFTLYTDLCEVESLARAALDDDTAIDGDTRRDSARSLQVPSSSPAPSAALEAADKLTSKRALALLARLAARKTDKEKSRAALSSAQKVADSE